MIKSTPTVLGVFRQALDHNQSPVIFITKPGHLIVVRRTLLFWIIGIVTQAVSMRDVEKRVAAHRGKPMAVIGNKMSKLPV